MAVRGADLQRSGIGLVGAGAGILSTCASCCLVGAAFGRRAGRFGGAAVRGADLPGSSIGLVGAGAGILRAGASCCLVGAAFGPCTKLCAGQFG